MRQEENRLIGPRDGRREIVGGLYDQHTLNTYMKISKNI